MLSRAQTVVVQYVLQKELQVMHKMMIRDRRRFRMCVAASVAVVGVSGYMAWPYVESRLAAKSASVATDVLADCGVKKHATVLATDVTADIMDNPATLKQAERLVTQVADSVVARDALRAAIIVVMRDPETQKELKVLVNSLLDDPEVQEAARVALGDVFTKLFSDKKMQQKGGDYVWGSAVASVTPSFMQ